METRKTRGVGFIFYIILIAIIFVVVFAIRQNGKNAVNYTYEGFINDLADGKVKDVTISQNQEIPTGKITVKLSDDSKKNAYVNDVEAVEAAIMAYNKTAKDDAVVTYKQGDVQRDSVFLTTILPFIIVAAVIIFIFVFMNRQAAAGGGSNSKMMNFGKSRAKMMDPRAVKVTFKQVAGLSEEKEELEEIVDFLKNPKKYTDLGARIPKGVILVGPPGTGKTLLAKAVAGEAGVPFFSISGSDFVEMFVGVGASRVRDLFEEGKKHAPCIIFIDEIDAIGKSRDGNYGGGNDEREQTLNQLLSEMDGFDSYKGIIILGATNRPEVLDKALLRPGRFDRRIIVEKPDLKGRVNILKVHSHDVLMDDTVDLEEIALATSGAVGADLANMVNEAAIMAVKDGRSVVNQKDLFEAVEVVIAGKEKKDRILGKEEKEIVAYHETGHALVATMQKNAEPVQKITIVPRTKGSLGYTMQVPEEEKYLMKKSELLTDITTFFGGRAAEEVVFGDVTTGASNDIERATAMARSMVTQYGMSDRFGLMGLESIQNRYLDGSAVMNCGEATESMVDEEVKKILDECYQKALDIIRENQPVLKVLADFLIEHETITGKQFVEIFEKETGIELKHDSESDKAGDQEEEKEEVKPQQDEKEQEE